VPARILRPISALLLVTSIACARASELRTTQPRLASATEETLRAGTSSFRLVARNTTGPESRAVSTGAYDFRQRTGEWELSVTAPEGSSDTPSRGGNPLGASAEGTSRQLGPVVFTKLATDGRGVWYRIPRELLAPLSRMIDYDLRNPDLRALLSFVDALRHDVRATDSSSTSTTYRGNIRLADLPDLVPRDLRGNYEAMVSALKIKSVPLEVKLDEENRVRQIAFSVTHAEGAEDVGTNFAVSAEFDSFGQSVAVDKPRKSDVIDLEPTLRNRSSQ
jgi:hypothetical protein